MQSMPRNRAIIATLLGLAAIASLLSACATSAPTATPKPAPAATANAGSVVSKRYSAPPPMTIDKAKKYTAIMTTTKGSMTIQLFASEAPTTVNNFVFLAREGYYANTIFHRTVANFMIQGGDPTGTGTGSPGYKFNDERVERKYTRGTLAMANSGPNTNGSQFFIIHQDYPLPPNYTIFGSVVSGLEVLDAIASAPVTASPSGEKSKPVDPVKIIGIEIKEG